RLSVGRPGRAEQARWRFVRPSFEGAIRLANLEGLRRGRDRKVVSLRTPGKARRPIGRRHFVGPSESAVTAPALNQPAAPESAYQRFSVRAPRGRGPSLPLREQYRLQRPIFGVIQIHIAMIGAAGDLILRAVHSVPS